MSRSNPQAKVVHPCTTWFKWNGEKGVLEYYDKEAKKRVHLPSFEFTFIHLDELATISGYNEKRKCGIVSNEVRDSRTEALAVKFFNGEPIANGFYATIKDTIHAADGQFSTNIYAAAKDKDGKMQIVSILFAGAALNAWIEFSRKSYAHLTTQAVQIVGVKDGQKGSVKFKTPVFAFKEVKQETNDAAVKLDLVLQAYLVEYFKKTNPGATPQHSAEAPQPDAPEDYNQLPEPPPAPPESDDVPY